MKVVGKSYYFCAIINLRQEGVRLQDLRKINRFLAINTLRDAICLRGISKGVLFHTDCGYQFISADFRKVIDELGMVLSFSAKWHPYDNALMECFFKYLKKAELNRRSFQSVEPLKQSLVSYISGFYNPPRPTPITMACPQTRLNPFSSRIAFVHYID